MEFPQDFTARERALLGARFDELYAYATPQPARGVTVNALRCTPEWFAQHADFDAKPSKFCQTAFTTAADFRPGRHAWHHAGVLYAQEPSASAPAALLDVQPGMRWPTSAPRREARPASWRRLCRGRACCWPMNSSPPALKFCARISSEWA